MGGFHLASSPHARPSSAAGGRPGSAAGRPPGTGEVREHGYLLSVDAKKRLTEQGNNYRTVESDPVSPAARLLGGGGGR